MNFQLSCVQFPCMCCEHAPSARSMLERILTCDSVTFVWWPQDACLIKKCLEPKLCLLSCLSVTWWGCKGAGEGNGGKGSSPDSLYPRDRKISVAGAEAELQQSSVRTGRQVELWQLQLMWEVLCCSCCSPTCFPALTELASRGCSHCVGTFPAAPNRACSPRARPSWIHWVCGFYYLQLADLTSPALRESQKWEAGKASESFTSREIPGDLEKARRNLLTSREFSPPS